MDLDQKVDATHLSVPASRHRRRGLLLVAGALFQFWVWGTRIFNLLEDAQDFPTAFVVVHLVLYVVSILVGVVVGVIGLRMWREARTGQSRGRP